MVGTLRDRYSRVVAVPAFGIAVALGPCVAHAADQTDRIGLRPVLDGPGGQAVDAAFVVASIPSPHGVVLVFIAGMAGLLAGLGITRLVGGRRERRLATALARARLFSERLIEQTGEVVLRIGHESSTISDSIQTLVCYSVEEMRTIAMAELIHPDDLEKVAEVFRAGAAANLNFRVIRKNGDTVFVDASFGHLDSAGEAPETLVTIRDVTQRHLDAGQLRDALQAVQGAKTKADEAGRAKSDFLASMSHEIRTPLNAILGFADLLLGTHDLPASARLNVERIKGGGDALLTIVNDILDFSQAEAGALKIAPRPFALPLLIDECVALVERAAIAKHLALRVELVDRFPPGLLGDDDRLRQILLNLLNNAIKFTSHGSVTIRIGYDRNAGVDRILFQVSDTGIGIATEDLPCLFQRFRQVDGSVRRTYGGTGLGLAISKMLIELMGGAISVTSVKGVGSTFWFALTLPPASLVLATERDPIPAEPQSGLHILLVEDVPINQELTRAILEANGHTVDVVADGADAIMAADDTAYDLVLMDVQMPYVDGFSATRAIRELSNPACCVPIVAMTANVLREHVEAAYAAGMNDFIPKPISIEALLAVVERVGRPVKSANPRITA